MTGSFSPNDVPLIFSVGRDPRLPTIYQMPSHPKKVGPGKIYYYIQDLSKAALTQAKNLEEELKIPYGPKSFAISSG
jgi:hypothetical protein